MVIWQVVRWDFMMMIHLFGDNVMMMTRKSYLWGDDTRYDDDASDRLRWFDSHLCRLKKWFHQQEARREPSTTLAYILPPSPRLKYVFDAELFLKSNIGVVSLNE